MNGRSLVPRFGAGIAAGMMGVVMLLTGAPQPGAADPILDAPFGNVSIACEWHCRSCGAELHDIVVHKSHNPHDANHLETCNPGTCASHACGGRGGHLAEIWGVLRTGDVESIREVLAANSQWASYNRSRQAVQITCEAGSLIASFPLTLDQAMGL